MATIAAAPTTGRRARRGRAFWHEVARYRLAYLFLLPALQIE